MSKTRLHIVQIVGVLLLMISYLVGNPPDSRSTMHFDSDPDCPSVMRMADESSPNDIHKQVKVTEQNHHSHKTKHPKHISFEVVMPVRHVLPVVAIPEVVHAIPLPDDYYYLFFEEINPPPPKSC